MCMEGSDYTNGAGEYGPAYPNQLELDALKDANQRPEDFENVIFTKKRMISMATTLSD